MNVCVSPREFQEQCLEGLVRWLGLDESVMPVMAAFLSGLGFEGSDTFLSILLAEPLLADGATPVIQVLRRSACLACLLLLTFRISSVLFLSFSCETRDG